MLIVRENSEGLYAGRERSDGDEAVAERVITRHASERIARLACELAATRRGHVTIVHKANVLRATCGLFREDSLRGGREFPAKYVEECWWTPRPCA
jgi:homoisocitrate dehydrogenase